jgi:hypothetical protein
VISINNLRTHQKAELAKVLRAIADWVEICGNETVTIDLKLTFNPKEGD